MFLVRLAKLGYAAFSKGAPKGCGFDPHAGHHAFVAEWQTRRTVNPLVLMTFEGSSPSERTKFCATWPRGGIRRHARLRNECLRAWGFKSLRGYQRSCAAGGMQTQPP